MWSVETVKPSKDRREITGQLYLILLFETQDILNVISRFHSFLLISGADFS